MSATFGLRGFNVSACAASLRLKQPHLQVGSVKLALPVDLLVSNHDAISLYELIARSLRHTIKGLLTKL